VLASSLLVDAHEFLPLRGREQGADPQHASKPDLVQRRFRQANTLGLLQGCVEIRGLLIEQPAQFVVKPVQIFFETAAFRACFVRDRPDLFSRDFVEPEPFGVPFQDIFERRRPRPFDPRTIARACDDTKRCYSDKPGSEEAGHCPSLEGPCRHCAPPPTHR
jgi:hypothetical protein